MVQKKGLIDAETMAAASASVSKLPTLKSKKAAAVAAVVIPMILAVLPTVSVFVPQITPFIGGINYIAKLFGYGA